ncbi:MAG: hypothetical protein MJ156_02465, partial [Alphaproteobacteria bacterium]|nr:hypothetical protein [Alphaproteobacteria bacterium]
MSKSHKSFFSIALISFTTLFCAVEAFAVPVVRKLGTSSTTASSGLSTVKTSSTPNTSTTTGSRIGVVKASGISGASKGLSTVRTATSPARLPVGKSIKSFNTANVSGLSKIKKSTGTGEITPQTDVDLSGYYTKIEVDDLADQKLNISDLIGDDNYVYVDAQQDGSVVVGLDMDALADYIETKVDETEQQERGRIQSQVLED